MVDECDKAEDLQDQLREQANVYGWLNALFDAVDGSGLRQLFEEMCILPTQTGAFLTRSAVAVDDDIDENLKAIADRLAVPGRKALLAREITCDAVIQLLPTKSTNSLRDDCIAAVKTLSRSTDTECDNFAQVNSRLLGWCVENEAFDELDEYPVLCRTESDSIADRIIKLDNNPATRDRLPLYPMYSWPKAAQPFVEIWPEKCIIGQEYEGQVSSAHWTELSKQGFLSVSFVYETRETVSFFAADGVLTREDDSDGETIESRQAVQVQKIAFLNARDGIIDRIRKNKRRAALFVEALMKFFLQNEGTFDVATALCTDDKERDYFISDWLTSLKTKTWVPFKKSRTTPNAEALGSLLRSNPGLAESLLKRHGREFLKAIGVGSADLTLHTLSDKEETRTSLMASFSSITRAAGNDVDRIRRVADELGKSPQLLERIEEHTRTRERVEQNQSIGFLVELLLSSALSTAGLNVTRTGVGSDFEAEVDFVEGGGEQALEVASDTKSTLIEIKSARSDTVAMTTTQARTAVREKDRFMLCVVVVDLEADIDQEYVRANSFFVPDIGERLTAAVGEFDVFDKSQAEIQEAKPGTDIAIDISEFETRFRITTALVRKVGIDFDTAVDNLAAAASFTKGGTKRSN